MTTQTRGMLSLRPKFQCHKGGSLLFLGSDLLPSLFNNAGAAAQLKSSKMCRCQIRHKTVSSESACSSKINILIYKFTQSIIFCQNSSLALFAASVRKRFLSKHVTDVFLMYVVNVIWSVFHLISCHFDSSVDNQ